MAENEYEIECIVGKRQEQGQVMYAVKWEGFPKSEITWETLDSFNNISELFIRRFERCQSYRYYWLKLQDKEQGQEKKRVHIIQGYSQVQLPFKPLYAYTQDRRPQYFNDPNPPKQKMLFYEDDDSNYYQLYNPDPIFKRPRGRPRKVDQEREMKERLQQQQLRSYNHNLEQQALSPYCHGNSKLNIGKSERTYIEDIKIMQKIKENNKPFKVEQKKQERIKEEPVHYPAQFYHTNTAAKMDKLHHKTKVPICFKQTQTDEQAKQELYDDEQNLIISQTQCFDQIISHQVLSEFEYKLYFKCLSQDQEFLYVDYNQLQQYNPTLLLDYMTLNAKLL